MSEHPKFKKGDIVLNRWAGPDNPTRHFIIRSIRKSKVIAIYSDGNNLRIENETTYSNVYDIFYDGKPAFVKVGESKVFDLMKEELTKDYGFVE